MGSFCTKCGRPLADGEVCNCTSNAQQPQQQPQPQPQQAQNFNNMPNNGMNNGGNFNNQNVYGAPNMQMPKQPTYFSVLVDILKKLVKSPITEGKAFAEAGMVKYSVVFIVLQAIMTGFFGLVVCSKISSALSSVTSLIGGLSSLSSGLSSSISDAMKIPYFSAFMGTVVISAALSFLLALLLFCAHKLIKHNVTYQQMMSVVALRSGVLACTTVIAIIVSLINLGAGLVVFFACGIVGYVIFGFIVPNNNQAISQNVIYMILLALLVFAIVMAFVMSKGVNLYLPSGIKTGSKLMQSLY
jgi:hypothetical protein